MTSIINQQVNYLSGGVRNMYDRKKESKFAAAETDVNNIRENIRKLMHDALQKAIEEELQKASQELQEEQRKAIGQILEEHKTAIKQVVDEEKKAIWEKAELLRQSILKFGL
jgi:hypothetical protein